MIIGAFMICQRSSCRWRHLSAAARSFMVVKRVLIWLLSRAIAAYKCRIRFPVKRMTDCCKTGECKVKNFLLDHHDSSAFGRNAWGFHPVIYIIYRIITSIYYFSWLIFSFVNAPLQLNGDPVKWPIFLTNQAFFILVIYLLIALIVAIVEYIKPGQSAREIPASTAISNPNRWYHKLQWIFFNVTACLAFVVTIGYWSLIYDPSNGTNTESVIKHGTNSIVIFIDIFVTATPCRIMHMWQPMLYLILYIIFTVIYWAAGATNDTGMTYIYGFLNYEKNPGLAAGYIVAGVFVCFPLVFAIIFGLTKLRDWLVTKLTGVVVADVRGNRGSTSSGGSRIHFVHRSTSAEDPI